MARGDIRFVTPINEAFTTTWIAPSGQVKEMEAGEPTIHDDAAGSATGAISKMANGGGVSSQRFTGICKDDSTDTVAAAGVVVTYIPLPGLIYKAKATTATNANTAALVNAFQAKRVTFDLDLLGTDLWSVDEDVTDAIDNMVVITGGEYQTSTLWFVYAANGTYLQHAIPADS